jgi:hypothetical protein
VTHLLANRDDNVQKRGKKLWPITHNTHSAAASRVISPLATTMYHRQQQQQSFEPHMREINETSRGGLIDSSQCALFDHSLCQLQ